MKESQFLAPILLGSPLMFQILEKIRDKHSIDKLDLAMDPYRQRVRQDMEHEPPIDWQAVRQDLEREIRAIPDLLPPELAAFQKIIEGKKIFPQAGRDALTPSHQLRPLARRRPLVHEPAAGGRR